MAEEAFNMQGAGQGAAAGSSFGPWGAVAGAVIGGLFGSAGQQSANQVSQQNAQAQMDFQERMSNTAHQREVKDLMAAGLNPMLSARYGGASTPGGAMAPVGNVGMAGAQSASMAASTGLTQAQTALATASTRKTEAEAEEIESTLIDEHGKTKGGVAPGWNSLKAAQMNTMTGQIAAATKKLGFEIDKLQPEQLNLIRQEIRNAIASESNIKADTRDTTANAILRELDQARAKNAQAFQLKYKDYNQNVGPFIRDAGTATSSAASALRSFKMPWRK